MYDSIIENLFNSFSLLNTTSNTSTAASSNNQDSNFTIEKLYDAIKLINKTIPRTKLDDEIEKFIISNNCTINDVSLIVNSDEISYNGILPLSIGKVKVKTSNFTPRGEIFILLNKEINYGL